MPGYRERLARTLPRVKEAIAEGAAAVGREASSVRLVAVTKGHPVEAARAALDAGLTDLGENRVEALEEKAAVLAGAGVRWHLIGHVQGRKAARALAAADLIHSVDTLRLAGRLSRGAEEAGHGPAAVLLQVNTTGESTKSGFPIEGATEALLEAAELRGIRVEGLMTMAPLTDAETVLREAFRRLRELLNGIRSHDPDIGGELSMGMTNDLRIAVEEGSTMVRVGTALFGEGEMP